MRKSIIVGLLSLMMIVASCKKNGIAPVSGTIDGKPAISLYGSSNKPTDYVLIDTNAADKTLSYDGIVFTYIYNTTSSNIYILSAGVPAADGVLTLTGPKIVLAISNTYTLTFGSTQYTSR